MTTPKINSQLSIGNVITIGMLLVAMVGGYYQFETRLSLIERQLDANAATIKSLQVERDDSRDRLTRLEVQLSNVNTTLGKIANAVGARP